MEDTPATVSYGFNDDHVKIDDYVESNPDLNETVEKKLCLDHYETEKQDETEDKDEDEDTDVSSVDSMDCRYMLGGDELSIKEKKIIKKNIKREIHKKFKVWSATIKAEDEWPAFLDTTGASILEVDGYKLRQTNPTLVRELVSLLHTCRRRMTIYTFTRPDESGLDLDGGSTSYESFELSEGKLQSYSSMARKVIEQYNETVHNKNSDSKLEFVAFTRVVDIFCNKLYITFTARQGGNGEIGTYQAALCEDFRNDGEIQLVLLRHVEADKILAILSISGADEELKMYGGNWNH